MAGITYVMKLKYDGTRYEGWQRQTRTENTIQGKLEAILTRFSCEAAEVQGAGRTDAGVHALGQMVSVALTESVGEEELRAYLNKYLPEDVAVVSVKRTAERFHARLNAKWKRYCYHLSYGDKPVFDRKYCWHLEEKPDVELMRQGAAYLLGVHDFRSFCANKQMKKSTVRNIMKIKIAESAPGKIEIYYVGDGFLYHMVRILTGTLLEIGQKKRKPEDILRILSCKVRKEAGITAPPHGLFLEEVGYEEYNCFE